MIEPDDFMSGYDDGWTVEDEIEDILYATMDEQDKNLWLYEQTLEDSFSEGLTFDED